MNVLISGAGIAGLACARELSTRGHDVTVVESASHLRVGGTPIDIRGDAIHTVDRMGLLAQVRAQRIRMSESAQFVDSHGLPIAHLPLAEINDSVDDIEILREDLMRILADALPASATIHYDESITTLADGDDGAEVGFASGRVGRYDLVIGADGQHSGVRRLVFGPDARYVRHLGVYFALAALTDARSPDSSNAIYNEPGLMAGIFRYHSKTVAVFQFRSPPIQYDHRDLNAQKQLLIDAFAGHRSWRIPELLDAARADPGFYFTAASQVHLPCWHRGRVVLVGDAGYCPAFLSGRGTSLALTGAHLLAEELDRSGEDLTAALARYETRQRPYVTFAQSRVDNGRDRILPPTWAAIAARNRALRTP